jgi:hypothetical protein
MDCTLKWKEELQKQAGKGFEFAESWLNIFFANLPIKPTAQAKTF